jgi:lipoprotein signal peptidase
MRVPSLEFGAVVGLISAVTGNCLEINGSTKTQCMILNVADSGICVGVGFYLWHSLREPK